MVFRVLDATAFYAGLPFRSHDRYHITDMVYNEIQHIKKNHDAIQILIDTKRLLIQQPSHIHVKKAKNFAEKTGDLTSLSSEDIFHFNVDLKAGTAEIDKNSGYSGSLVVPLRPMIGCFGVAPDRGQAISTATSGPYGGNMDYLGFCEGTTAYLPIFVDGALFHIGDGHAWQSDGEILGTGIEISMDVEFTLTLVKGSSISWPRGENNEYIFTAGNARPLDEAIQHATSEMLYWLQDAYGMNEKDANIFLGMFVKYDVGNVFDPAYTMICKIPKESLPDESKKFLL